MQYDKFPMKKNLMKNLLLIFYETLNSTKKEPRWNINTSVVIFYKLFGGNLENLDFPPGLKVQEYSIKKH